MNDKSPGFPYNIDHAMVMAISRIERGLGAIGRAPLLPQLRQSMAKAARRRSSRASAAIEGVEVSEAGVEAIDSGLAPVSRNEREVAALIKLYEWVQSQPVGYVISEQDCKRLHQLVWNGIIVKRMTGRYRRDPVQIWDAGIPVYEAPPPGDVPRLMRHLGQWLENLQQTEIHPVMAAGVAQYEFVRIHPFMDGNGRSSRGLSALILRSFDYDAAGLLAHEDQILSRIDDFYRALEATDRSRDLTPWLHFYLSTLADEVERVLAAVESLNANEPGFQLAHLRLNARQRGFLQHLQIEGRIRARDAVGVSQATFYRDMRQLVDAGLVLPEGKGKGRSYILRRNEH